MRKAAQRRNRRLFITSIALLLATIPAAVRAQQSYDMRLVQTEDRFELTVRIEVRLTQPAAIGDAIAAVAYDNRFFGRPSYTASGVFARPPYDEPELILREGVAYVGLYYPYARTGGMAPPISGWTEIGVLLLPKCGKSSTPCRLLLEECGLLTDRGEEAQREPYTINNTQTR